jgi:hypothetical protein
MARITQYTQENTPQAVNQGRPAQAADFGGNQTGLLAQADAARTTGAAVDAVGQVATQIETKRRNRIDTINLARMTDQFYNDAFNEYNRALAEDDIIDPATTDKFNETIRAKSAAILSQFTGSPEARAKLEIDIMNQASTFTRQMTQTGLGAQRSFLIEKAGGKIATLAQQVREDPSKFNEIMLSADSVVKEFSPGLYAEDELAMQKAARSQVSMSALNTYIDRGMYDEANALIDSNPAILESIDPETQRRILQDIDGGLKERQKTFDEAAKRRDLLVWGEKTTGQKVDPMAALNFITEGSFKKPDEQIINDVAKIYKMKPEDVPAEMVLRIKYPELKLNDGEVDPNKDFGPGNKLTVGGISKKLTPVVISAEDTRMQIEMMRSSIEQARAGNKVAGQGAVTAFKKMLDPTSAVMEGEITMVAEAEGLRGRLDKMFDPGKPVSAEQLAELEAFAADFTSKLMASKKNKIDNLLVDADTRGFRRIDIGLPENVYKDIFGTDIVGQVNPETPAPAGLENLSDDDLKRMLDERGDQ